MAASFSKTSDNLSNRAGGIERPTRKSANGRARPKAVTASSTPIRSDATESGTFVPRISLRSSPPAASPRPASAAPSSRTTARTTGSLELRM
jgi:hypothetical protein